MLTPEQQIESIVQIGRIEKGQETLVEAFKEFKHEVREGFNKMEISATELRKDINNLESRYSAQDERIRNVEKKIEDTKKAKVHPLALAGIGTSLVVSIFAFIKDYLGL